MFRKEFKYLLAHYILKVLETPKVGLHGKMFFHPKSIEDIHQNHPTIGISLISEAALILKENNHVLYLSNFNDVHKSTITLNESGYNARKDRYYWRLFLRSGKGILLTIGALASAILAVFGVIKLFS